MTIALTTNGRLCGTGGASTALATTWRICPLGVTLPAIKICLFASIALVSASLSAGIAPTTELSAGLTAAIELSAGVTSTSTLSASLEGVDLKASLEDC